MSEITLSPRETQFLTLLADGQRQNEIAKTLKLSPKTVATYQARVMKKLNFASSRDLLIEVIKGSLSKYIANSDLNDLTGDIGK